MKCFNQTIIKNVRNYTRNSSLFLSFVLCCSLFIFSILFDSLEIYKIIQNSMLINEQFNNKNNIFHQPFNKNFENQYFNLNNFNYSGVCSNPFKYKPNNKRDLLFNTAFYDDKESWDNHKEEIQLAIEMSHHTIPDATKILYLYGNVDDKEFEDMFTKNGYKIIRSKVVLDKKKHKHIVSQRYLDFEEFMIEHQNEYDRVIFADLRDVYWFADGFATISPDEFILMNECDDLGKYMMRCLSFRKMTNGNANYRWVNKFYGENIAKELKAKESLIVNGGFVGGNTQKMLQFLSIMCNQLKQKPQYLYEWGYDQATMSYIFNTGKLDSIGIIINTITQRLGWDVMRYYKYDKNLKALFMNSNGCSPVIRHKLRGTELFSVIFKN